MIEPAIAEADPSAEGRMWRRPANMERIVVFAALISADSRVQWPQSSHTGQVVRAHRDERVQLRARSAEEATLTQACHRLQPTERLLNEFALALREVVAGMAHGPRIESRDASTVCNKGDVRSNAPPAQLGYEVLRAVSLVPGQCLDVAKLAAGKLPKRRSPLTSQNVINRFGADRLIVGACAARARREIMRAHAAQDTSAGGRSTGT